MVATVPTACPTPAAALPIPCPTPGAGLYEPPVARVTTPDGRVYTPATAAPLSKGGVIGRGMDMTAQPVDPWERPGGADCLFSGGHLWESEPGGRCLKCSPSQPAPAAPLDPKEPQSGADPLRLDRERLVSILLDPHIFGGLFSGRARLVADAIADAYEADR